jgi:hypothetical protein
MRTRIFTVWIKNQFCAGFASIEDALDFMNKIQFEAGNDGIDLDLFDEIL